MLKLRTCMMLSMETKAIAPDSDTLVGKESLPYLLFDIVISETSPQMCQVLNGPHLLLDLMQ